MSGWREHDPWYHGSDQQLIILRAGSSITPKRDLARAFSHKPSLLAQLPNGRIQHNGQTAGYLYVVAEALDPHDIYPHPHPVNVDQWEWLLTRDVVVHLVEQTALRPDEQLTEQEIAAIRRKQQACGEESFTDEDDHGPSA